MKIPLNEVWTFIEMMKDESEVTYALCAGGVLIEALDRESLSAIKNDEHYDTELLPSIFTFREILWQPDVFTEATMTLPAIRILKGFCEETAAQLEGEASGTSEIYRQLILGIAAASDETLQTLDAGTTTVVKALRQLRQAAFPIVKFFIYHPKNRPDYQKDAVNRLNYAVKVMLTQFYGQYSELKDPYWQLSKASPSRRQIKKSGSNTVEE